MMKKNEKEKNELIGKLDDKNWVQKSKPLVMMKEVSFSLGEFKILDTYISRINAADDSRRTVTFTKSEYEELMGISYANYRTLRKYTASLLRKIVTLQYEDGRCRQVVLFEEAFYDLDEYGRPIIQLTCTTRAKELFFCIGQFQYIQYALKNIIHLHRKASYFLYLYIISNRYRSCWDVELQHLRDDVMHCSNRSSYQSYKIFKRDVLEPAVKEVNEKTDCHFGYMPIKNGRSVVKIRFTYYPDNKKIETKEEENPPSASDQFDVEEASDRFDIDKKKYGDEYTAILAYGVDNTFSKEEMEEIRVLLTRIDTPDDQQLSGLDAYFWGASNYLREKYAAMNTIAAKKQKNGEKINDRFSYFKKMLKSDVEKRDTEKRDTVSDKLKPKKSKMPSGSFYHFEQRQYGPELDNMLVEASMGEYDHDQEEDFDEGSDNS